MYKTCLTFFLIAFVFVAASGQDAKTSKKDKAALDSLINKDKSSYFEAGLGISNSQFSQHDKAVNANQAQTNKIFFTPAISYHHKSGLGLSVMPYLSSDSGSFKLVQTAVTPSYDYLDEKIGAGAYYTRYIADNTKWNSLSTFQNDFYAYVKSVKGAIQPGFALGYTTGTYKEINSVNYTPPLPAQQIQRTVRDSTTNDAKVFTMVLSVEHNFNFTGLFSKEDEFTFDPQLMLNLGNENLSINHVNAAYAKLLGKNGKLKNRASLTQSGTTKFTAQSAGLSLDFGYSIGKFTLSPSLYFDYYLPKTTLTRLNTFYSLMAAIDF